VQLFTNQPPVSLHSHDSKDPHRGNLLRTPDGKLAFIDFGMMADIDEGERYGLFGLVIGLQNKDLPLVTENLLKLGFLKDTTQLDLLIPRLRAALLNSTGGTGKASDVNFAKLQAELDNISRENILRFATPPFFTIIIRSLTILEGVALTVDPGFKLVRGSYPYVLRQLLSPEGDDRATPAALQKLLIRLLTVNGEQKEIEWERLRDFLRLAQKASKVYDPTVVETEDKAVVSRQTIEMFASFLTSRTGIFLKKPLVHELAEVIDSGASNFEANLLRSGVLPTPLPGMNGPVNARRMEEMRLMVETFRDAVRELKRCHALCFCCFCDLGFSHFVTLGLVQLMVDSGINGSGQGSSSSGGNNGNRLTPAAATARIESIVELFREASDLIGDARVRQQAGPMMEELQSVIQMVAVEVLEIRGARAMRNILNVK
jgi:ABC1 atypical kinase-like domain